MTGCPDPGRLAAAASDQDAAALSHAATCGRCGPLVDELRATAAEVGALPAPVLSAARRASIEDAVLVAVDAGALAPRRRWPIVAGVAMAAAAAAVVVIGIGVGMRGPDRETETVAAAGSGSVAAAGAATGSGSVAAAGAATGSGSVAATGSGSAAGSGSATPIITPVGQTDHTVDGETLALRDGVVLIDTRRSGPLSVRVSSATRVTIADARVEVRAKKGVLVAVQVFAGSAEVTTGRRHTEIVAGDVWEPEPPKPRAKPSSVDEFRKGWIALRAGDHDAATRAFDRATDPSVAEDAAFWAAVARERAGDTADARARFERFLAAFPASARADAARDHLAALAP